MPDVFVKKQEVLDSILSVARELNIDDKLIALLIYSVNHLSTLEITVKSGR